MTVEIIHLFISHLIYIAYNLKVAGKLERIPADSGQEMGYMHEMNSIYIHIHTYGLFIVASLLHKENPQSASWTTLNPELWHRWKTGNHMNAKSK